MQTLTIGIETVLHHAVTEEDTACHMGSGSLRVLSTPTVIAWMEGVSCTLLAPYLSEDVTTVGTKVDVAHIRATPVGGKVTVKAELTALEDRKYTFRVTAEDQGGIIAQGTHERFAVKTERFLAKTYQQQEAGEAHA